jgi:hypothetical protein
VNKLFYISLIVLLFSCSPQKRLNRLIKKHPELVKIDTIVVRDTIRDTVNITTNLTRVDTIFSFNQVFDTITITKDNLTVRYYHDTVHDKVYISGECDTIWVEVPFEKIVEYKVPCNTASVEENIKWWYWVLLLLLFLIAGWTSRELLRKEK